MALIDTLRQKNPNLKKYSDAQIAQSLRKRPEFAEMPDEQFGTEVLGIEVQSADPAPRRNSETVTGLVGDVVDATQSGFYSALEGLGAFTEEYTGVGEGLQNFAGERADYQLQQMSPRSAEAIGKQIFESTGPGVWDFEVGEGANPLTVMLQTASLAGEIAPSVAIPGGLARTGISLTGKVLGKAAAGRALRSGASKEAAQKAAQQAAQDFALSKTAKGIKAGTFGAAEAAINTGQISLSAADEVLNMPDAELDQSEAFQRSYWDIADRNPDMGVSEIRSKAREELADATGGLVMRDPALLLTTGVLGGYGGKAIDDLVTKGVGESGNRLTAGIKQAATQFVTESGIGGIGEYSTNKAIKDSGADPNRPLGEGVGAAGLSEGVLGGIVGGATGVAAGTDRTPAPVEQTEDPTAPIEGAPVQTPEEQGVTPGQRLDETLNTFGGAEATVAAEAPDIAVPEAESVNQNVAVAAAEIDAEIANNRAQLAQLREQENVDQNQILDLVNQNIELARRRDSAQLQADEQVANAVADRGRAKVADPLGLEIDSIRAEAGNTRAFSMREEIDRLRQKTDTVRGRATARQDQATPVGTQESPAVETAVDVTETVQQPEPINVRVTPRQREEMDAVFPSMLNGTEDTTASIDNRTLSTPSPDRVAEAIETTYSADGGIETVTPQTRRSMLGLAKKLRDQAANSRPDQTQGIPAPETTIGVTETVDAQPVEPSPVETPAVQPTRSRAVTGFEDTPSANNFDEARTGVPLRTKGYRVNNISAGDLYEGAQVPILGRGQYTTPTPEEAARFSPDPATAQVTEQDVDIERPLVIENDKQWSQVTRAAGWDFAAPIGQTDAEVQPQVDAMQSYLRDEGYDGVVIKFDPAEPTDTNANGDSIKRIREVFGEPQAVRFDTPEVDAVDQTSPEPVAQSNPVTVSRVKKSPDYDATGTYIVELSDGARIPINYQDGNSMAPSGWYLDQAPESPNASLPDLAGALSIDMNDAGGKRGARGAANAVARAYSDGRIPDIAVVERPAVTPEPVPDIGEEINRRADRIIADFNNGDEVASREAVAILPEIEAAVADGVGTINPFTAADIRGIVDQTEPEARQPMVKKNGQPFRTYGSARQSGVYKAAQKPIIVSVEDGFGVIDDSPSVPTPAAQRIQSSPDGRMSAVEVDQIAGNLMTDWSRRPAFLTAQSESDLPADARKAIQGDIPDGEIAGAVWRDTVYLIADNLKSVAELEATVLHEVVGHWGLRQMLGRDINPMLDEAFAILANTPEGESDLNRLAADYGLQIQPDGANRKISQETLVKNRRIIAEEYIANLAETDPDLRLMDRIVALVSQWMRRMGFQMELTSGEIRDIVVQSKRYVRGGNPGMVRYTNNIPLEADGNATPSVAMQQAFTDPKPDRATSSSDNPADMEQPRLARRRDTGKRVDINGTRVREFSDGSMLLLGDPTDLRKRMPRDLQGRVTKEGLAYTPNKASRARNFLEGRQGQASRAGRVTQNARGADGKYIGAPERFNTPQKIGKLRRLLNMLAKEGEAGRFWYENSGRAILRMTGYDKQEARKMTALLSIYSPQAKVDTNGTFALRAWAIYQSGNPLWAEDMPVQVKSNDQDRKAQMALEDIDAYWQNYWKGEKTNNFFWNLLSEIESENQGATIDMWMMRAAQYDHDAPNDSEYRFMENEVNRIANDLGWEPQQVQAAIWVAMKARMENPQVKDITDGTSEAAGYIRFEPKPKGKPERVILNRQKHNLNWVDHGMAHDPTVTDLAESKFDFEDALQRHVGQISWEARPSTKIGVLPGIENASYATQQRFQQDVREALRNEQGRDLLSEELGLFTDFTLDAPGIWDSNISAGTQNVVPMAPRKPKDKPKGREETELEKRERMQQIIDPAQRETLDLYSAMLGLALQQDGVGYHRPAYSEAKMRQNAVELRLGRALTGEEAQQVYDVVNAAMDKAGIEDWEDGIGLVSSPQGMRVINFEMIDSGETTGEPTVVRKIQDNNKFRKIVLDSFDDLDLPFDFESGEFYADGGLEFNDWEESPDGQAYTARVIAAGRPDLLRWGRDVLAPKVQAVFERYSQEEGWGDPGDAVGLFDRAVQRVEDGEDGSARLRRVRFDGTQRPETVTGFEATPDQRHRRQDEALSREQGESEGRGERGGEAARARADVVSGDRLTGDGLDTRKFFEVVTKGDSDVFKPIRPYRPAIALAQPAAEFRDTRNQYRGNFDTHIATSIPGFEEVQSIVGSAIVKSYLGRDATMLDIGSSEGSMIKAVTEESDGAIKTVGLDPNASMVDTFERDGEVDGSTAVLAAFGNAEDAGQIAWTEDDGTEIPYFDPAGQKFDIVQEAMTFQFISNARNAQIKRVKELMTDDGVAIFEEKFGDVKFDYDAAEDKKDFDWKANFYTEEQIKRKREAVLEGAEDTTEGMTDKQVAWWEMEQVLSENFDTVIQFWEAGNFRGYIASDSSEAATRLVENMQSTDTTFANQDMPRAVTTPEPTVINRSATMEPNEAESDEARLRVVNPWRRKEANVAANAAGGAVKSGKNPVFERDAYLDKDEDGKWVTVTTKAPILKEQSAVKKLWEKYFTKEAGLGEAAFQRQLESQGIKNEDEAAIQALTGDLRRAVARTYGVSYTRLSDAQKEQMNRYLTGEDVKLPKAISDQLDALRGMLDNMSTRTQMMIADEARYMIEGLPVSQRPAVASLIRRARDGDESAFEEMDQYGTIGSKIAKKMRTFFTIEENKGSYMNRSYRVFDDAKKWRKDIPDEVMTRAKDYLRKQVKADEANSNLTEAQIERKVMGIIENILGTGEENMIGFMSSGYLGQKDLSILKKRKDIAPEIRELMGEYKDPTVNFSKSMSKMSYLTANHYFLRSVREEGMGEWISVEKTQGMSEAVSTFDDNTLLPLAGLYTAPEFAKALRNAASSNNFGPFIQNIIGANSLLKYGKTVLSPTTMARNYISAAMFTFMNGHWSWDAFGTAMKVTGGDIKGNTSSQLAYIRKLARLGVLHDNPRSAELKEALEDVGSLDATTGSAPFRFIKGIGNYATKAYRAGDDFWKIIGFENEKAKLVKSGMSEADAEARAARRIRDGYPTYSMVPEAIKMLRRFPLAGTFVSFPWEIMRTSFNQIRMVREDFSEGRRDQGMQRLAGMAVAGSAAWGINVMTMAMMGIDEEDDEAIRFLAAPWQMNSQFAYLGRDEEGKIKYLDLSHLDPYNHLKRPITALVNGNYDSIPEKAWASFSEFFSPFLGVDIGAGILADVYKNKKPTGGPVYDTGADIATQGMQALDYIRNGIQPGVFSNIERTLMAFNGQMTSYGREYTLSDEALAWVGFRLTTSDPKISMQFKAMDFNEQRSQANLPTYRVLGNPNVINQSTVDEKVASSFSRWEKGFDVMHKVVRAGRVSGMDRQELIVALRRGNVPDKYLGALLNYRVPAWSPSNRAIDGSINSVLQYRDTPQMRTNIQERLQWMRKALIKNQREMMRTQGE